jgi:hypothetical protein
MPSSGPKENVVFGLIIGSEIGLVGTFRVRSVVSDSTRSVVVLIKYLVWETVHYNAFTSKISSESRFRLFSDCKHKPAARLEWLRRNLKFRCGTLRYRGETGVPTLFFFVNRFQLIGSDLEKDLIAQAPLGRTGKVGDIAPIAVFLASDDSAWLQRAPACNRRHPLAHPADARAKYRIRRAWREETRRGPWASQ